MFEMLIVSPVFIGCKLNPCDICKRTSSQYVSFARSTFAAAFTVKLIQQSDKQQNKHTTFSNSFFI